MKGNLLAVGTLFGRVFVYTLQGTLIDQVDLEGGIITKVEAVGPCMFATNTIRTHQIDLSLIEAEAKPPT